MKAKKPPRRKPTTPRPFKATLQIERAGVSVFVDNVPRAQLADVIGHVLNSLKAAGVKPTPDEPQQSIEQIGGYAALDVRESEYEQFRKTKRVGF